MRTFLISSVLGLLLVTALSPSPALGAETIHFAQDDQTASALFSNTDPSGCVLTEVSVIAVDGRSTNGPGPKEQRSEALATISQYDVCAGTVLRAAEGRATLDPGAFEIDNLESAALNTSIEVFDSVSNSSFVVDVALVWEGVGDPVRQRVHTHIWTRAFTVNFRFDGTDRQAAAAGTVTDGTTDFAPEPGVDNAIRTIQSGRVTVQRN